MPGWSLPSVTFTFKPITLTRNPILSVHVEKINDTLKEISGIFFKLIGDEKQKKCMAELQSLLKMGIFKNL